MLKQPICELIGHDWRFHALHHSKIKRLSLDATHHASML